MPIPDADLTPEQLRRELDALRKRVQALEASQKALSDRERQYRTIYMSMREDVALHDVVYNASGNPVDYRILEVNPSYTAITGLAREQAIQKPTY